MIAISKSDIARFYKKVSFGFGPDSCWVWLGGVNTRTGRGTFWIDGDTRCASRTAYRIYFGEFDDSLFVCHRCDNPNCVNPAHLFLGTNSDNQKDLYAKGLRCVKGENGPGSKLNNAEAKGIRELYSFANISQRQLAKMYGVTQTSIHNIVNYKTFVEVI